MSDTVKIILDGVETEVAAGISVAAAVLGHQHDKAFHHNTMDASPRSPYCLMGVCFECMLEIDNVPNVQSCLVTVKDQMIVNRQTQAEPFNHKVEE